MSDGVHGKQRKAREMHSGEMKRNATAWQCDESICEGKAQKRPGTNSNGIAYPGLGEQGHKDT